MTFDEWMLTKDKSYVPTDDSMSLRLLRECWFRRDAEIAELGRGCEMTQDELNTLKSLQATFSTAFAQTDIFWMKEIMASGLISLEALINRSAKPNEPVGDTPCPECNPTGVFNYSPARDCICDGKAWIFGKKQ